MRRFVEDKLGLLALAILCTVMIMGIFAPVFSLHDPLEQNIAFKFAGMSWEYPFGTDHLGRCIYARLIFGIRNTVFLAVLTMVCTISIGVFIGVISGYYKGVVDEMIMRFCDVMLSFPSQVMILAIVGVLGVGMENIIIANIVIKWTWYARMIRGMVAGYNYKNYVLYAKTIGKSDRFIISRHLLPNISSEIIVLATLDMGWVIINISMLSFLGLGIQPPFPEWGAMLNEAKNVLMSNPSQMIAPGVAILVVVASFNILGDSLRDMLAPKGSMK
ncbi:nickel/cobalt ABC transporter permease [Sulfurospirillum barnesii]|uniref:Nickel ABC transporter, permease subunit NikC n=1 Tax=Sulfurospirillum barnesii (strain ATCC 700032 / DSM 10660 / SES-3) TaxID=760154 RepID=I3XTU5_SULBS|nr:nickel/cobalt ABC transporter permease [Sulfurospirillum barnesii]AFL67369.1 nickel ABC transporter, permease subunit NikC [Sulfurospirillum barnesii SES-3]